MVRGAHFLLQPSLDHLRVVADRAADGDVGGQLVGVVRAQPLDGADGQIEFFGEPRRGHQRVRGLGGHGELSEAKTVGSNEMLVSASTGPLSRPPQHAPAGVPAVSRVGGFPWGWPWATEPGEHSGNLAENAGFSRLSTGLQGNGPSRP